MRVVCNRIWTILAGDSAAAVNFETFGKFILEAPTHAGLQVTRDVCDAVCIQEVMTWCAGSARRRRC